jgi:hypothetical protein
MSWQACGTGKNGIKCSQHLPAPQITNNGTQCQPQEHLQKYQCLRCVLDLHRWPWCVHLPIRGVLLATGTTTAPQIKNTVALQLLDIFHHLWYIWATHGMTLITQLRRT